MCSYLVCHEMVMLQGRVEQGLDGSYRMKVDKRYETLPLLRRTAKYLCPLWFLLLAAKSCFIGAPMELSQEASDPASFMTFGGSAVPSVFAWMVAALGSRSERLPGVIAFNVFTILTVVLVRLPMWTILHVSRAIQWHKAPTRH